MTTLSILMPTYNCARYIGDAVASSLAVIGGDGEVVVQDGGSTDGTLRVLRGFEDRRLSVVSEPDDGQSDALNRALSRARGEWCGWLNGDDIYLAGFADLRRNAVELPSSATMISGAYLLIGPDGRTISWHRSRGIDHSRLLRSGCVIFSGATLARAEAIRRAGGFGAAYHYAMDYDLFLRMSRLDNFVHETVLPSCGALRVHSDSKSVSHALRFVGETRKVRLVHDSTWSGRVHAEVGALMHLVTIKSTGLRQSRLYRSVRGRVVRSRAYR